MSGRAREGPAATASPWRSSGCWRSPASSASASSRSAGCTRRPSPTGSSCGTSRSPGSPSSSRAWRTRCPSSRRTLTWVLVVCAALVWLVFFPNAPYILTDFLHLGSMGDTMPGWYDVLMLYWYSWTGLLLGVVSLYLMQEIVATGPRSRPELGVRRGGGPGGEHRHLRRALLCAGTAGTCCAGRGPWPSNSSATSRTRPRSRGCSDSPCSSPPCSSSSTWRCTSSLSSPSRAAASRRVRRGGWRGGGPRRGGAGRDAARGPCARRPRGGPSRSHLPRARPVVHSRA